MATQAKDEQLSLLSDRAHARSRDPQTSKEAAASLGELRPSQREVLQLFRRFGAMDDRELIKVARHEGSRQSDSSLRSRRSELSKPNMERMWKIAFDSVGGESALFAMSESAQEEVLENARQLLRVEGYRSPLIDSGKRVKYSSNRNGVIWKLAPGFEE